MGPGSIFTTQLSGHVGSLFGDLVGKGASGPVSASLLAELGAGGKCAQKSPREAELMGSLLVPATRQHAEPRWMLIPTSPTHMTSRRGDKPCRKGLGLSEDACRGCLRADLSKMFGSSSQIWPQATLETALLATGCGWK